MTRKLSKVERAKRASRALRGEVAATLEREDPAFGDDDVQVLKFHGIYQQDDRDARVERRQAGLDKEYNFMVRARIPGGRLGSRQLLTLDRLAERFGPGRGLRLTSRQGVQLHGVLKGELRPLLGEIDATLLTTLGACGDVGRNVMLTPVPIDDEAHRLAHRLAADVAERLELRTGAYHEIWLEGERWREGDEEPLYGESYLPRKFKVGVTVAGENAIDVFTQDVGLVVVAGQESPRVDLLVGGGLGMTHAKADTFARLATPLGSVTPGDAAEAVAAVAQLFRDHGERTDRRHARLKYLVEEWGIEAFREELVRRAGLTLGPWIDPGPFAHGDLLGAHPQGDGRSFFGLWIENGRLRDDGRRRPRAALGRIAREIGTDLVITPSQNLIVRDLDDAALAGLREILGDCGLDDPATLGPARRFAMACPALPTCGLALADAERVSPGVLDELERTLASVGLGEAPIAVRMTGCPNGCARPYTADVGLVGRAPGQYDVYVGGGLGGDRLGELYEEKVPLAEIAPTLEPLLVAWRNGRRPDEGLGTFYWRLRGGEGRASLRTGAKEPSRTGLGLTGVRSSTIQPRPNDRKRKEAIMTQTTDQGSYRGIPRIGDPAPDFTANTTHGEITFSEWQGDDWVVLFSHPADFTPVCTTELAAFARRQDELTARGVKLLGLSIDSIHSHLAWRESIREGLGVEIGYPLVADLDQAVARLYGLLHPGESETATVRALFVIDPARTVRAIIYYPLNVGRSVDEVLRLVDALQTATTHAVALPVDWRPGDSVVVPPPKTVEEVSRRRQTADEALTFYLHKRPLQAVPAGDGT
jgi:sulfite reductase beta subunit-like hemoprotein/alkyl hydroperoxide reductase subunit AhpC